MWEVVSMDDKELIKRIMEEVKDEKLREELLGLVAEKNRRQSEAKQEEDKPMNHKTRHGILFKVGRIIGGIILFIILTFAFFFIFSAFEPLAAFAFITLLAFLILLALQRIIQLLEKKTLKVN
jgi:small-conductance mechanosensitive channel